MRSANLYLNFIRVWKKLFSRRNPTAKSNLQAICPPTRQDLVLYKEILEKILTKNIIAFWYPQVIDLEDGGFRLNYDIKGKWKGRANKHLVAQARTVWFFSRLARTKYGTSEHLKAAKHGYEFLCDRMWDKQFGGFYWEVDSSGSNVIEPNKHLYGQAFGLYAVSEYAIASGNSQVTALAQKLFNLLEYKAHDPQYGGYREFFQCDWSLPPSDIKSYMNTAPTIKQLNTHIHLMEALTPYYSLTKNRIARERLIELIFLQSNAVVRKTIGACTDKYQLDWTPLYGSEYDRITYGHDLENVWLLIEACNAAGISNGPLLDLYKTLFNYSLRYGFDRERGGFYYTGPFNAPADRQAKIWWVQAEGLVSALQMYRLTGEKIYFNCFSKTLDWIVKQQTDWEFGEWYAQIGENGKPSGDKARNKAGAWKSPYHNGRAMIKCLELLLSF